MTDSTTRRNGQLSSCEPCRKAKVRCDHARPQCGRCMRRGLAASQCYYHPAPMSQRKPSSNPSTSYAPSSYEPLLTPAPTQSSAMMSQSSAMTAQSPAVSSPAPIAFATTASTPSEHFDRSTGLVGMNNSLGAFADDDSPHNHRVYAAIGRTGVTAPSDPIVVSSLLIEEGAGVLDLLTDSLEETEHLINRFFADEGEFIPGSQLINAVVPIVSRLMNILRVNRSPGRLRATSKSIFDQTPKKFQWPPNPEGGALQEALCPDGIPRWEVIGIYASMLALFLSSDTSINAPADFYQQQKNLRSSLARKMFDIALKCEGFTHVQGQVNDLTLWLMCKATMASTWCFGDDSYCTWRSMSMVSSMVIALSFHRPNHDHSYVPHYALELRRSALALVTEIDKGMATFVGRPPFLSRLYYSFEMPLDLPPSVLMVSDEAFEAAKATLDSNGWSTDGKVHPTLRARVMVLICPMREESLELSMGNATGDPEARATQILSDLTTAWLSIPAHLRYETAQHDRLPESGTTCLAFLRLEFLYTQFILFKCIVNHDEKYRHRLIQVSHEIVSIVLLMVKKRTALVFHRNDSEWAAALYAMPCAGVLLLELFRQIRQPQTPTVINRSTIIKDMTALILCCDWLTETGQGNYRIIRSAQSIFSRGLDQVLDHPQMFDDGSAATRMAESSAATAHETTTTTTTADLTDADFAMLLPQDLEWSTWLESFGLQTDPWFDLAHQVQTDFAMEGVAQ